MIPEKTIVISDDELNHFAELYGRLNRRFDLLKHGLWFDQFLMLPDKDEVWLSYWISIYTDNPALFMNRPGGGKVLLQLFLMEDPAELTTALLNASIQADGDTLLPLMPAQRQALGRQAQMSDFVARYRDDVADEMHGNQLRQPIKHRIPASKRKTGSHKRRMAHV